MTFMHEQGLRFVTGHPECFMAGFNGRHSSQDRCVEERADLFKRNSARANCELNGASNFGADLDLEAALLKRFTL